MEDRVVSHEAMMFKEICTDMYDASTGFTFEEVVSKVMQTKYRYLMEEATLEDIGYIFDLTRERVRQIEDTCIGKLRFPDSNINKALYFYTKQNPSLNIIVGKDRPGTPLNREGKPSSVITKITDFEHTERTADGKKIYPKEVRKILTKEKRDDTSSH